LSDGLKSIGGLADRSILERDVSKERRAPHVAHRRRAPPRSRRRGQRDPLMARARESRDDESLCRDHSPYEASCMKQAALESPTLEFPGRYPHSRQTLRHPSPWISAGPLKPQTAPQDEWQVKAPPKKPGRAFRRESTGDADYFERNREPMRYPKFRNRVYSMAPA